jgi:hypothetical protein
MHKAFEKIAKAFLWPGSDVVQAEKCLVAWGRVQRPLHLGGLGILDLQRMGTTLHLQWLWYWHTDPSRPWSAFPPSENSATVMFFKASIWCTIGIGTSTLFWLNPWLKGHSIEQLAPDLVASLVGCRWRHR